MAQITVKLQNGMVGTMDDSEFNPSTMQKLGDPAGATASSQGYSMPSSQSSKPTAPIGSSGIHINDLRANAMAAIQKDPQNASHYLSVYNAFKPSDAQMNQQMLLDQLHQDVMAGANYSDIGPRYTTGKDALPEAIVRGVYNQGPIAQKYGPATETAADLTALASGKPTTAQAAATKKTSDTKNAVNSLYSVEDAYNKAGPLGANLPEYANYESQKNLFADALAQSLGVSRSNPAVLRIMQALPGRTDSIDGFAGGKFAGTLAQILSKNGTSLKALGLPEDNSATPQNSQPKDNPFNINDILGNLAVNAGKSIVGAVGDTLATGANMMGVPKEKNPFISAQKLKEYAAQTQQNNGVPTGPFMNDVAGASELGSLAMGTGGLSTPEPAAPQTAPQVVPEAPTAPQAPSGGILSKLRAMQGKVEQKFPNISYNGVNSQLEAGANAGGVNNYEDIANAARKQLVNKGPVAQAELEKLITENTPLPANGAPPGNGSATLTSPQTLDLRQLMGSKLPQKFFGQDIGKMLTTNANYAERNQAIDALRRAASDALKQSAPGTVHPSELYSLYKHLGGDPLTWAKRIGIYAATKPVKDSLGVKGPVPDLIDLVGSMMAGSVH